MLDGSALPHPVLAASRDLPVDPDVVVILPTFRRPAHLLRTMASLAPELRETGSALIVMDNDADNPAGAQAARTLFENGTVQGVAILAEERGNCSAYNAGFRTALALFPRFRRCLIIDDDEIARPNWIRALCETMDRTGAAIVGGPQIPTGEPGALENRLRHPVFQPPYAATGSVPILYSSGNVALRRDVIERAGDPVLDTRFNFVGGGDSDFYARMRDAGTRFAWCAEAELEETVPARRTEFSWLHERSLRNGAISALIEHRRRPGAAGRARTFLKTIALLGAAPFRGPGLARRTGSRLALLYPLQVAIGRLQAEFGRVGEQYRQPERN